MAGLTSGSAELIIEFGDKKLNETYVPKMLSGHWGGTMCLTEPVGSSLSDIVTKATPTEDGHYEITGQKIFISGGDNQFAPENIVHLVLARVEGAPKGT